MSWSSILPESISFIETWLVRLFLFLGALTIGPWLLLLVYDAVLYLFRTATYEIPYIGGRARHRPRPRAPSLTERPSGKKRGLSMSIAPSAESNSAEDAVTLLKKRGYTREHEENVSTMPLVE